MSNVISMDDHRPHLSGPCQCVACRHEWVAVAPVGTTVMTCPSCGEHKGGRFSMILPPGDTMDGCGLCGNVFFVLKDGVLWCPNCGDRKEAPYA